MQPRQAGPGNAADGRLTRDVELRIGERLNSSWNGSERGSRITFIREPIIRKTDKVMTMGSCFAVEVKAALRELGFDVYPKYDRISLDRDTQHLAKLPEVDDINHYNTFSIRAEFDRAFAGEHYELQDFLRQGAPYSRGFGQRGDSVWRDPFRRHAYAKSEAAILDLSRKIDDCIRAAVMEADVYVITLGMVEAWRNDVTGRWLNQAPALERRGMPDGLSVHFTSYADNYNNVRSVCALLQKEFPQKRIVLTVSPVSFKRTFSGRDLIVANTESKSILRAVAGAVEREFSNVTYWPSYEIAMAGQLFDDKGREVTRDGVRMIVEHFAKVHVA